MIIDFNSMPDTVMPAFRGGQKNTVIRAFADASNRIMRITLEPGASIGMHTHETDSEIVYILSGTGTVTYCGEKLNVSAGDCHYCPKGQGHDMTNTGDDDLVFFAVVPAQ